MTKALTNINFLKMKKSLLLLIFVGITFLGCSDNFNNTPVSPSSELNIFKESRFYVSKIIDGYTGGWIEWDTSYVNGKGGKIYASVSLKIPKKAFNGTREIIIIPNPEETTIQFFPEMVFNKSLKLDYEIWGFDPEPLGYLSSGKYDFAYFDDYGNIELILSKQSKVNIQKSRIKVLNAKLEHFSRYGWIR